MATKTRLTYIQKADFACIKHVCARASSSLLYMYPSFWTSSSFDFYFKKSFLNLQEFFFNL